MFTVASRVDNPSSLEVSALSLWRLVKHFLTVKTLMTNCWCQQVLFTVEKSENVLVLRD